MNALNFVIVSQSIVWREGIFAFLRENSYSPNCITKLSSVEQFNCSSCNGHVMILDDSNLSQEDVIDILSHYMSPSPKLKMVLLSLCLNIRYIEKVVEYSNTGYVYKPDFEEHFLRVVGMLNFNMMSISETALNQYLSVRRMIELNGITDTDFEVLYRFADGQTVNEVLEEMSISQRSVYRIKNKWQDILDAPTSDLIVDHARQLGML